MSEENNLKQVKTITVRNVKIGDGIPKICISVMGRKEADIIVNAQLASEQADIVEWRADFYEDIHDTDKVIALAEKIRQAVKDVPLLFTIRSIREGGECQLSADEYEKINEAVIKSGFVDMADVEIFTGIEAEPSNAEVYEISESTASIIKNAKSAGVIVVASNHDFDKTPSYNEIIKRLRTMKEAGADIPKIAVMPNSKKDVFTLLSATAAMSEDYADGPVISMSMSDKGVISRIIGESTGSAVTFASLGTPSAPGQVEAGLLRETLNIVHQAANSTGKK